MEEMLFHRQEELESLNISSIGVPISCSTFTTCDVQEPCNLPSTSVLKSNTSILNTPQTKNNLTRVKPSVRNIQMCNYNLLNNNRNQTDKNTIIHQQTMEFTPVQGNCILNKTNIKLPDANRFSMDVNTSLDNIYHKCSEDDNGDGENKVGGKKNLKHGHMAIIDEENDQEGRFIDNKVCSINKLISDKESLECDAIEGTPEQTQQSQLRRNISRLVAQKTSIASKNGDEGRDGLDRTIVLDDLTLDKNPKHNSPVSLSPLSPMPSSLSPVQVKKPLRRRRVRRNVTQTVFTRSQVNSINHGNQVSTSSLSDSNLQSETQRKKIIDKEMEEEEKKNKKKRVIKISQKIDKNGAGARVHDNNHDSPMSSNVFMENKRLAKKSRNHSKSIIIVATGLCNGDKDIVREAIKKIAGAKMESTVSKKTTHVVTTGVRTINLLRGIIRGCWENRRDREIFGSSYVPELFTASGLIHIQNNTTPPQNVLKELIKTAGGYTIDDPKKARIIIGPTGIKELWVLDSITTGELQSIDQYKR
ncbi:uncharacterized protein LOC103575978 [Microplitis demolitor]|uniref:uncharacterized protein LOC103575978 n=1 Tax=Microplitis demolitor TaxID=69319 RepID=UPI00235B5B87|nr:uncharacterized protein LOC103575978 [Microplitis demolitor]